VFWCGLTAGMTVALSPQTIEELRAVLKPRRERYGFAIVMQRWAALACEDETAGADAQGEDALVTQLDALVTQLIVNPAPERPAKPIKQRRPRADRERYAAIMLGMIFHEFTGKRPKRTWDPYKETDQKSPFYVFAAAAFRAMNFEPSWQAFREAGERWDRSRAFSKQSAAKLLFGGLVPREKSLVRRRRAKASPTAPPLLLGKRRRGA
jgi:hypothetical protein